jgi:hypothetical protein
VVSTDLAKITNTYPASGTAGGKMNAYLLSLAKRLAKNANPRIRPITVNDDEEWFTVFLNSDQFRDVRNDPVIMQANRDAMERGKDNPLFRGGDLLWDQMIIREIPELGKLAGAGAAGIDVAPGFLCGAQALGVAWAQRMKSTTNTRDYGFMHGVGIQEMRGIDKLRFGRDATNDTTAPVDAGIFTIFAASVADA